MKKLQLFLVLTVAVLLASCGGKKNPNREVEYIPFQESSDGNWGMISTDGDVLFSEEFQNQPTAAVNGRFMVKNSDGLWEIYTAEKKPKKIGGEYLYASLFYGDVAAVVEKGQRIQFIDRDGKVKVTLDKINGKAVTDCAAVIDGKALVRVDGLWGVVNEDGDVVIEPNYTVLIPNSNGYYLAVDKKYAEESDNDKKVYSILDKNGKEVGSVKGSKFSGYDYVSTSYRNSDVIIDKTLVLKADLDGKTADGLMNFDGEWAVKPAAKFKKFYQSYGKYIIFNSGDGYGLMDKDGEEIIRAKYNVLAMLDDDILIGKKSGDTGYTLYNLDEEKLGKDEYLDVTYSYDGKYAYAQASKHDWVLIDKKGEEQKLKVDIYNMGSKTPDNLMVSDYLDVDDAIGQLKITKEGFLGLTTTMVGPEVVSAINSLKGVSPTLRTDAYPYRGDGTMGKMQTSVSANKATVALDVNTYGLVKKERTGSGWFTYTKDVWSEEYVKGYLLTITAGTNPQLEGKMKEVYDKLLAAVKQAGKVQKEEKNAAIIDAGQGLLYLIGWGGKQVVLYYGYYRPETFDLNFFDSSTEDEYNIGNHPLLTLEDVPEEADGEEDWGELESPPADDL